MEKLAPERVYVSADEVIAAATSIIARHLDRDRYRVFLFGSRARKTAGERSDIDIGIEGKTPVPLEVMSRIRSDIEELPTLRRVDVVDLRLASKEFRGVALAHTVPLSSNAAQSNDET